MTRDYAMFSEEGNAAVAAMVKEARELDGQRRIEFLRQSVRDISREHQEIRDTMVREIIAAELGDPGLAYWTLAE